MRVVTYCKAALFSLVLLHASGAQAAEGRSVLIAGLDGKTFEVIARADMPQVYALGPHGSFVEGDFGL